MHTSIDQNTNERIHHFLASRSTSKKISEMIIDWLVPPERVEKNSRRGIAYEQLDWSRK
jgi:hypothetical protein